MAKNVMQWTSIVRLTKCASQLWNELSMWSWACKRWNPGSQASVHLESPNLPYNGVWFQSCLYTCKAKTDPLTLNYWNPTHLSALLFLSLLYDGWYLYEIKEKRKRKKPNWKGYQDRPEKLQKWPCNLRENGPPGSSLQNSKKTQKQVCVFGVLVVGIIRE